MSDADDGFVQRWSRRKRGGQGGLQRKPAPDGPRPGRMRTDPADIYRQHAEVGHANEDDGQHASAIDQEGEVTEGATAAPGRLAGESGVASPPVRAEAAAEDDAPPRALEESDFAEVDFDKLDYEADFTRFLQEGVPDVIRRKALRRLWRSNPVFAVLDGLNEYDEDYTDAALAVEVLKTAHKLGRGYADDEETEVAEAGTADKTADVDGERVETAEADGAEGEPEDADGRLAGEGADGEAKRTADARGPSHHQTDDFDVDEDDPELG